jgi:serine phosphatase RsbU (regulator of sigma subunit)
MKLRTQLLIVFLLVAILPLAGIVSYSYVSSQKAFREAVGKETQELAAEMDSRMAGIRADLGRRIERISGLPIESLVGGPDAGEPSLEAAAALAAELGESAHFLDRLEWIPDPAPAPGATVAGVPRVAITPRVAPAPNTPEVAPVPASPPAPAPPELPTFVIEIPRVELGADGSAVVVGTERREIRPPKAVGGSISPVEIERALEQARRAAREARESAGLVSASEDRSSSSRESVRTELSTAVVHDGSRLGTLTAQLRQDVILRSVLSGAAPSPGDVAFAIDEEGNILGVSEAQRAALSGLDVRAIHDGLPHDDEDWVLATSTDADAGLVFCVARPVRDSLRQMRASAANSFFWGVGLLALALFGIIPVANHLTRDIERVLDGVDRIGRGDLDTPVEVQSTNEIGRLATAFNRMAIDLKDHQRRLFEEERLRQGREIEQRVLEAEYGRKSAELEEARRFQLSLLPDSPPTHPDLQIAVHVRTATEVGGDYYDYHENPDGSLTLAIGDATGHGAKAGTMVTVVKSLFAGMMAGTDLSRFLDHANHTIRQMRLERMAMALTVAQFTHRRVEIASAGMPPALLYRAATRIVEEIQFEAPPLGSLLHSYRCRRVDLEPGDLLLMMTDGFPELENPDGDPLGYVAAASLFRRHADLEPADILARFSEEADDWTGGRPDSDDMTFIAIRVRSDA